MRQPVDPQPAVIVQVLEAHAQTEDALPDHVVQLVRHPIRIG